MDLLRERPAKLFGRYLLPSIGATLVTSVYIIADTVMIGRGVGADALIALNLILPLFAVLFAFGMLFGVGGGVQYSVAQGAGDENQACAAFSTALVCVVVTGATLVVLCTVLLRPLCFALGADGRNIDMVLEYGANRESIQAAMHELRGYTKLVKNAAEAQAGKITEVYGEAKAFDVCLAKAQQNIEARITAPENAKPPVVELQFANEGEPLLQAVGAEHLVDFGRMTANAIKQHEQEGSFEDENL